MVVTASAVPVLLNRNPHAVARRTLVVRRCQRRAAPLIISAILSYSPHVNIRDNDRRPLEKLVGMASPASPVAPFSHPISSIAPLLNCRVFVE